MEIGRAKCALLVLCGLPGSGKTTLARQIREHVFCNQGSLVEKGPPCKVQIITFDDWLHPELIVAGGHFSADAWQRSRQAALAHLTHVLAQATSSDEDGFQHTLIVADDNNHLRSMRYELFRAARAARAAFLQLHVPISHREALRRNGRRRGVAAVPSRALLRMAAALEPPQPERFSWEAASLTVGGLLDAAAADATAATADAAAATAATADATAEEEEEEEEDGTAAAASTAVARAVIDGANTAAAGGCEEENGRSGDRGGGGRNALPYGGDAVSTDGFGCFSGAGSGFGGLQRACQTATATARALPLPSPPASSRLQHHNQYQLQDNDDDGGGRDGAAALAALCEELWRRWGPAPPLPPSQQEVAAALRRREADRTATAASMLHALDLRCRRALGAAVAAAATPAERSDVARRLNERRQELLQAARKELLPPLAAPGRCGGEGGGVGDGSAGAGGGGRGGGAGHGYELQLEADGGGGGEAAAAAELEGKLEELEAAFMREASGVGMERGSAAAAAAAAARRWI